MKVKSQVTGVSFYEYREELSMRNLPSVTIALLFS